MLVRPYTIQNNRVVFASADCLADARSIAKGIFRLDQFQRFVDIFYGEAHVETIERTGV